MYFRYFLWNFAGRQNDIQWRGGPENGNWLSGIDFIDKCFGKNEIDEIWLTFSDPQAKKKRKSLNIPYL